jgi:hypothetical protein
MGRAGQLCPGSSDVDLPRYSESVVDLNAAIAHGANGPLRFLTECIFWTTVSRGIHFQKKPVFTVGLLGE